MTVTKLSEISETCPVISVVPFSAYSPGMRSGRVEDESYLFVGSTCEVLKEFIV